MINLVKLHANSVEVQTNHQIIWSAMENKFDTVICWLMEKTIKAKTPQSDFQVTILKNPLFKNQVITSIRNLITTKYIPKYQPTVKYLLKSPIGLDFVEDFFNAQISNLWLTTLHKSQYMTNFIATLLIIVVDLQ